MAVTALQIAHTQVAASATSYYTSTNAATMVQKATAFNSDSSARTIDIWVVVSGGSATDANKILEGKSIDVNATEILHALEGHVIPSGSSLFAQASTGSVITLAISGLKIT
jgi:predicted amino acid racemase